MQRGSFTPLVFGTHGGCSPLSTGFINVFVPYNVSLLVANTPLSWVCCVPVSLSPYWDPVFFVSVVLVLVGVSPSNVLWIVPSWWLSLGLLRHFLIFYAVSTCLSIFWFFVLFLIFLDEGISHELLSLKLLVFLLISTMFLFVLLWFFSFWIEFIDWERKSVLRPTWELAVFLPTWILESSI